MALFGLLSDNGPLGSQDQQLALAAGLLSGKGNWGANLSTGLLAANAAQQQERANRASDLQQLTGLYGVLQQQEAMRYAVARQSGQPYSPSPQYLAVQKRMVDLGGANNLTTPGSQQIQASPPPMPPAGPQAVPGLAPPSSSPMENPDYQPVPGAVRPNSATPAPASAPSAPPQNASGFGGPAGGLNMEDYMMVASNPGLKMWAEQYAKDHSVQNVRQGGFVVNGDGTVRFAAPKLGEGITASFGPNGQVASASAIPGYAGAASGIKGAETTAVEGAKFPGRETTVTLGDGRVVPQLLSNVVGNPYGGAQASASGLPFVTPPAQRQPGVATVTVADPGKSREAPANNDPWATLPTIKPAQGIGQSTTQKQLDTLRAEKMKALSDQYGPEADVAAQKIAQNTQTLKLVENADTGAFATHLGQYRNVLASLGISSAADKAATDQELAKDLVTAAIAKGKTAFTSRFTQGEVNLMLQRGSPSPEMQKEAIKYLLRSDNAQQKYNLQRGMDFGKAMGANGDPLLFSQWYATTHPINLDSEQSPANAPSVRRTYNPKTGRIE
jgi:hypothetical protein